MVSGIERIGELALPITPTFKDHVVIGPGEAILGEQRADLVRDHLTVRTGIGDDNAGSFGHSGTVAIIWFPQQPQAALTRCILEATRHGTMITSAQLRGR